MSTIIKVEGLGKSYTLTHQQKQPYYALRDVMADTVKRWGNRILHPGSKRSDPSREEFWALKDISFEIKTGDRVGIIGRNGAGKSTLLKILSRITEPTKGRVDIWGRASSLLEIGTGFHPELTGRENIYLNGAILGMPRAEIKKKFDEIVDFAEVEKFLDTPVKRYSSGMYVRLAFAVAAHLEPEILIVDEVLAVGDAQFQKKCLGKMQDVSASAGRTVLFVSHNMSAISDLCPKTIYLEAGKMKTFDQTKNVIPLYLQSSSSTIIKGIYINSYIEGGTAWGKGKRAAIEVSWEKYKFKPGWECDIAGYTFDGVKVFAAESQKLEGFNSQDREINSITFYIENIGFSEKDLRIDIGVRKSSNEPYDFIINDCAILRSDSSTLEKFARTDVIAVPDIRCKLSKK